MFNVFCLSREIPKYTPHGRALELCVDDALTVSTDILTFFFSAVANTCNPQGRVELKTFHSHLSGPAGGENLMPKMWVEIKCN